MGNMSRGGNKDHTRKHFPGLSFFRETRTGNDTENEIVLRCYLFFCLVEIESRAVRKQSPTDIPVFPASHKEKEEGESVSLSQVTETPRRKHSPA